MRFVVIAIAAATFGCARPPLVAGTFPTKEAAAQAVLDALARNDHEGLLRLAVSESEFREVIWPRVPASRPVVGLPVDYVWADTSAKSHGHLAQTLARYGGTTLQLDAVTLARPPVEYGTFRLHASPTVRLRRPDGTPMTVQLFGSLVQFGNAWKVFSYIVD